METIALTGITTHCSGGGAAWIGWTIPAATGVLYGIARLIQTVRARRAARAVNRMIEQSKAARDGA